MRTRVIYLWIAGNTASSQETPFRYILIPRNPKQSRATVIPKKKPAPYALCRPDQGKNYPAYRPIESGIEPETKHPYPIFYQHQIWKQPLIAMFLITAHLICASPNTAYLLTPWPLGNIATITGLFPDHQSMYQGKAGGWGVLI